MEYILIIVSTVFVNNIVLTKFLGICPFIGVSNKLSTAWGMSGAVLFVLVLSTVATFLINKYLLIPLGIGFMQTITFILVIAALVQLVEIILKKVSPPLYQALGIYLPLITTNCVVLGVAAIVAGNPDYGVVESALYAAGNGAGFGLALILFSGIREQMEMSDIPPALKGVPIAFITAGLMSLAFMGFTGIVK